MLFIFIYHYSVVTGVRWVVQNSIVYLELQGTKFEDGLLILSSKEWFNENDTRAHEYSGPDPIYLTANQRSICLDDVKLPDDMLVIGI